MNKQACDILLALADAPYINQRLLAERTGCSPDVVRKYLRRLTADGWMDGRLQPTQKTWDHLAARAPRNAVILAAGYGLRMVPINAETSKAFLEVGGEPLIERIIKQLRQAGILEIYVVVGYMKERFEYLMEDFGIRLIFNPDYAVKNNLHSLSLAAEHLGNSYIVPCDLWCAENPFRRRELYSWYMVSGSRDGGSTVQVNRRQALAAVPPDQCGNGMVGIAYLLEEQASALRDRLAVLDRDRRGASLFWEAALFEKNRIPVSARVVSPGQVVEINTYEQLRELDSGSDQLKSDKIRIIGEVLHAAPGEITNISALKKGMTNRSFLFTCRSAQYIMRVPGEGTQQLINRREEAAVYQVIQGRGLCEDVLYINPDSGYKISRFIPGARNCDPANELETARCMEKLRAFHQMALRVDHKFDIFQHIDFYESLWEKQPSIYRSYQKTKEAVFRLRPFLEAQSGEPVLTHIDAVPDNFLFFQNDQGQEEICLIDWEYSAMQDPHVDIAMFCIYAMYDRPQIDRLINQYFTEGCPGLTRVKIYGYIAACGLLWSNWCEYKRNLGVEFGAYSLQQYLYAKEYCKIVRQELERLGEELP